MGTFDFFKSKSKNKPIEILPLGKLMFSSENSEYAYRGKINFLDMEYKTEIVLPTNNRKISEYQLTYFKEIYKNLKGILDFATKMPDSKIELSKSRVESVLIPDKENNNYDIDAEIVITQKDRKIIGKNIYSIILKKLEVVEIITI